MNGRAAAITVVAKNYLPFSRVLADSLAAHHPELPLFVVLADEVDGYFHPETERFPVVPLDRLGIPDLPGFLFRYSRQEVIPAVKPFAIAWLLAAGFETALFLDADIQILAPLDSLIETVSRAPLTLTPHFLRPASGTDAAQRERNVLQCGVYNGGFVGATGTPETRRFLAWWGERLLRHCRYDAALGLHFDQRWLDLAPSYVPGTAVVRDPAYNVAYWNLPERAGTPIAFFHFSGYEPERPGQVTRYWPEKGTGELAGLAPLFARYGELLAAAGYAATAGWPYAYDFFSNRVRIPAVVRAAYAALGEDEAAAFGDPRAAGGAGNYYAWLSAPETAGVPRLWSLLYAAREDLREAFPAVPGADAAAFAAWIGRYGPAALEVCGAGPAARPLEAWEHVWQQARSRERSSAAARYRETAEAARARGEDVATLTRMLAEREAALAEQTRAAAERLAALEAADALLRAPKKR